MIAVRALAYTLFFAVSAARRTEAIQQQQDDGSDYFCTVTPHDTSMPLSNLTAIDQMQTIRLGWHLSGDPSCDATEPDFLGPDSVHWHVYSLPEDDGSQQPRIAMYPPGVAQPELIDNNTILAFRLRSLNEHARDDPIQAGVALWIPAGSMTSLEIHQYVGATVNIYYNGTDPLRVNSTSIENRVVIQSLQAPVLYSALALDSSVTILTGNVGGSSIDISDGSLSLLNISVPPSNTTMTESFFQLTKRFGNYSTARIVGDYGNVSTYGEKAEVIVNTNCNGVNTSDPWTLCSVDTGLAITDEDLEVSCLADTNVTRVRCTFGFGGIDLSGLGFMLGFEFVVVVLSIGVPLCMGVLVAFYCWCKSRRRTANNHQSLEGSTNHAESGKSDATEFRL